MIQGTNIAPDNRAPYHLHIIRNTVTHPREDNGLERGPAGFFFVVSFNF